MKKTLSFVLIALLSLSLGIGTATTSVSAIDPGRVVPNGLITTGEDKPYENPGAILVDVTDIYSNNHTAQNTKWITREISNRTNNVIASSDIQFEDTAQKIYLPPVILLKDGQPLGYQKPEEEPVDTYSTFSTNQAIPPSGDIEWDYVYSCANTGPVSPDPLWDCNSEIMVIENFVEGGVASVPVGIETCIQDVFGAPLNSQAVVFVREDGIVGAAAYYTTSMPLAAYQVTHPGYTPPDDATWVAEIHMPTGYGAPPNSRPAWLDVLGNPTGQLWQTSARNGRLETLTHEMIHGFYDQLNPYYHPWGEGMVEMQAILARRLWCQRNAYDPGALTNFGADWPTAMEKNLAARENLAWGVPVTLPNYENLNQTGIQASGGFFSAFGGGVRMQELMWTRYNIASSCWWKVWRETSPAIIDDANAATYGADTYFNDWNSRYYDYWVLNGPPLGSSPNLISQNVALLNGFTSDVLLNDIDMGGESNVEEIDYTSQWFGLQRILYTGGTTGEHLYVPGGPSQPIGGRPFLAGDIGNEEFICDFGAYYTSTTGSYAPAHPILYQTAPGTGAETGLAGELHIEVWEIDDNDDETTDVDYHNGGAWQALPAYGLDIPGLAFDGAGHLPNFGGQPQGLNFLTVGGDEGGFRITFSAEVDGDPAEYEAETVIYFACDEHQGPGNHTVVTVGDGSGGTDRMYFTYDGGAEVGPFAGGDSAYNDNWPGGSFSSHRISYRFDGNSLNFDSYSYANTGPYFYTHVHSPAIQTLVQDLPAYNGHIGHAVIVQSSRYNSPNDVVAASNRHYYLQFVTDNTTPNTDTLPDKEARPDYIPEGSNILAAYLYTNDAGWNPGTGWQEEPVLINPGKSTNQAPWEYCTGEYIGANDGGVPTVPPRCNSGGGNELNAFRFDITKYLVDAYDDIHVTNLYQQSTSGGGRLYGFAILVIFENEDLPLSRIMISDGAYDAGRPVGNNVVSTFTGFRTPPNVSEWEVDNGGAKAYITQMGTSVDNNPCGNDGSGSVYRGRWEPEWDFFAIGSDRLPEGDRLWPSPLPAPQGAWWASYDMDPNNVGDRASANGVPSYSPDPSLPPGFPGDYRFSPRASLPEWYSAGKQLSSAWFWNRPFGFCANKTAIAWEEGSYWDEVCHRDYADLGDGNGFGWFLEQRDVDDPAYTVANPFYNSATHVKDSYLAGNDTSVWYRPYGVCSDAEFNTPADDEWDFTDGVGPCVPVEIGNMNSGQQPSCNRDYYSDGRTRTCGDDAGGVHPIFNWPGPKFPTTEEEGGAHMLHLLQVPIMPSLSLTKTANPINEVPPDSVLTYTVTIVNDTKFTQQGVTLTENYPTGVTFLDANPIPDSGDNIWTNSISDDGNLDPGESFSVIIRVTVGHLDKGTVLTNIATVSAETAPLPTSATYQNVCLGSPVLTISKTSKKFMATQGDKIKFRIIVKNIGDREAMGVVLTDLFPREFQYVGSIPAGSQGLNKITWAIGQLNPGQTYYVDLILKLRDDIRMNPGISVINRAVVISSEGLKAQDESVLIVYRRPDQPITCPKPDIDVRYEGTELCVNVDKFGGCSPFTLRITSPANDIDILATIDEVEKERCIDIGVISTEDTLQIEIRNKYDGAFYYCYKITPDGIETSEIPCP